MDRKPQTSEELVRFMDERDAYREKAIVDDDDGSAAVVRFEFWFGDTVYLKNSPTSPAGLITKITIGPPCAVMYGVSWHDDKTFSEFYAFELTAERPIG